MGKMNPYDFVASPDIIKRASCRFILCTNCGSGDAVSAWGLIWFLRKIGEDALVLRETGSVVTCELTHVALLSNPHSVCKDRDVLGHSFHPLFPSPGFKVALGLSIQ